MADTPPERILAAALRLFARRGYGLTSMREVAEAAGVTKPALYYHFESKEQLYLRVVQVQIEGLHALIAQTLQQEGSWLERVRAFAGAYVAAALVDEDALRLMLAATLPREDGQPDVDLLAVHTRTFSTLCAVLQEGVDAGDLRSNLDLGAAAFGLVGSIDMHIMAGVHGLPLPDDVAERILDLFLQGAAPR